MNPPASNSARKMNGGQALAEMLKASGVGPMFGMGGFQLLPFYEAMRALGLRHYLINDERCGAFASDAYARVTNRPGVCDATLGPGATNLVTAAAYATLGGMPALSDSISAVTRLVAPGPSVASHTPGRLVTRA